jgi:hypothetical protein
MSTVEMRAVEMAVYGKRGKRYPRFLPFPQTLEIAPRFPHSHRPGDCYYFKKSNPKGTNPSTRSSFSLQAHPSIGKD